MSFTLKTSGLSLQYNEDDCSLVDGDYHRLRKAISKDKWSEVRDKLSQYRTSLMENTTKKFHDDWDLSGYVKTVGKDNMLHQICRHHPPYTVVILVLSIFPTMVTELNHQGRTPLHIAAAYGASLKVVSLIYSTYPEAALIRDAKAGKTPLHLHLWYCSNEKICDPGYLFRQGSEDDKVQLVRGPMLPIVKYLARNAPQALHVKDFRTRTPIQVAIEKKADCSVTSYLSDKISKSHSRTAYRGV